MNKYEADLDIGGENSLSLILRNIEKNSTILEFGPATGRMTKYLKEEMGCKVYIVEIDGEGYSKAINYAVDGYIGDIESYEWANKFKGIKFDYILFADVLEHLRNPEMAIKRAVDFLKDGGIVGASIPNIAHNSIIMNLLRNTFKYNQLGLLDNTHIKFFTYSSAKEMFEKANLIVCREMATYVSDNSNEFPYNINHMTSAEKDILMKHEFGNVYQFVFMAIKENYYEKNKEKINIVKNIYNIKTPYTLKVYVNTGNGDREEESLINSFYNDSETINFQLKDFNTIRSLRCDFFVSDKCMIKIDRIEVDNKIVSSKNLGGNYFLNYEDVYIFDNINPFVYIMLNEEKVNNVTITFSIEKIYDFKVLREYIEKNNEVNLNNNKTIEEMKKEKEETQRELELKIEKEKKVIQGLQEEINQFKNNNLMLSNKCDDYLKIEEKLKKNIEVILNNVDELERQKRGLEQELYFKNEAFNIVINSTCWRVTRPLRIILDFIKKILKSNKYTHLLYKTLVSLKINGLKKTIKKIKRKLIKRNIIQNSLDSIHQYNNEVIKISELSGIDKFNKKIAVHVHLYYVDLIDEFIGYLNNIPYKFDLFVSCKKGTDINYVISKLQKIEKVNNVQAEITINRGRDIAPLYVQFGKKIEQYDYFLHIHTKKSLYSGKERYGWRQYSLDCLLGNKEIVKSIFSLFESDKKVGLFIPEVYDDVPALALDWLANAQQGREILEGLGIPFEDGIFTYPVGSFFWAKTDAVKPLFEYGFKYEDFPEEAGQTDGTTAHALERVIAFVSKYRGYDIAIHEYKSENIFFGRTLKPFRGYFEVDIDSVVYHLSQYEVITFDIFDTLITRCIYQPDDLFRLMERKIKKKYNVNMNFFEIRKKSELVAWEKYHEYCSINTIYDELYNVANISREMSEELKQMEIETELSVCIPRYDVVEVFNKLKSYGKKIILVSDMYLTSNEIKKLLKNCGIEGYDDLWISCEKGARKDNNTIWPLFFEQYGHCKTIHVGDNMRSDIQILGDQGKETFLILNPITEFKLSNIYDTLKKYVNTTVENSLMLGMIVNAGLYNSPFSIQVHSAEPLISEDKKIGYIAFGAMFTNFINNIHKKYKKDSVLLFLAREGYLLEQLYKVFYESIEKKPMESVYFLSSRRAATVAAIENEESLRAIIRQYYEGSLSNLLKARLGIDIYDDIEDCKISMPADEDKVIRKLKSHMDEIIERAKNEAKSYIQYIDEILDGNFDRDISVIDVGYSGTIQYHLAKILKRKIGGYYLCTGVDKKPTRLGCECDAVYALDTEEDVNDSKIFKGQLFLEAALQAPYGQLVCFKNENGKAVPEFKDDDKVPNEIKNLQKGIIEYCNKYASIVKDIIDSIEMDKDLAEDIFYEILFNGDFSDEVCDAFNVQDDYCSNGSHKFDIKSKKWKVN